MVTNLLKMADYTVVLILETLQELFFTFLNANSNDLTPVNIVMFDAAALTASMSSYCIIIIGHLQKSMRPSYTCICLACEIINLL